MHLFCEWSTDQRGFLLHVMSDKLADLIGCVSGKFYKSDFLSLLANKELNQEACLQW